MIIFYFKIKTKKNKMNFNNKNELNEIKKEVNQEITKIKNKNEDKKGCEDKKRTINIKTNKRFKWSGFAPYKFEYYKM